jgi:hypothetical protein
LLAKLIEFFYNLGIGKQLSKDYDNRSMFPTAQVMKQKATLIREDLKTPRAAAAGILFSVLLIAGLVLFRRSVRADPPGEFKDRFFSTVFFGSGLLFLAMLFASAAVAGGIILAYAAKPEISVACLKPRRPALGKNLRGFGNDTSDSIPFIR